MKKINAFIFLLLFLVYANIKSYAQNEVFPLYNAKWSEAYIVNDEMDTTYHHYITKGDTLIENIKWSKIYRWDNKYKEETGPFFIRTEGEKVISLSNQCTNVNESYVLYEFGLEKGDLFASVCDKDNYIELLNIDWIEIGGIPRKRYD